MPPAIVAVEDRAERVYKAPVDAVKQLPFLYSVYGL